jgi:predicted dinucleotide-binding enzyme
MKIAVLGTGIVGRTLGSKLIAVGHSVTMGSRNAAHPEANAWAAEAGERAAVGEMVINATSGGATLEVLSASGPGNLAGKVLIDVSNPLDFSRGFPPSLSTSSDTSLAEQVQAAHPEARVVKTLNTMSAPVMVEPGLGPGHHNVFVSGNDEPARAEVRSLLESFGWPAEDILELGDITSARGAEMYLPLWLRLFGVVGKPQFNISIVRG